MIIIKIFVFTLLSIACYAQNLVHNGSFEELSDCPERVGDINLANGWNNGNLTPDLFSVCTNGHDNGLNVPDNYVGSLQSFDGDNYAGIVLFTSQNGKPLKYSHNTNEYIWSKLSSSLVKGCEYKISMSIALADSSVFFSDFIVASFSVESPSNLEQKQEILEIIIPIKNLTGKWIDISSNFLAKNNYKFFSIGLPRNFFDFKLYKNSLLHNRIKSKTYGDAYYYIDKVSIEHINH